MISPANLPIWMEPFSGNSSDKTSLHETINYVRELQKELKACNDFFSIAGYAIEPLQLGSLKVLTNYAKLNPLLRFNCLSGNAKTVRVLDLGSCGASILRLPQTC